MPALMLVPARMLGVALGPTPAQILLPRLLGTLMLRPTMTFTAVLAALGVPAQVLPLAPPTMQKLVLPPAPACDVGWRSAVEVFRLLATLERGGAPASTSTAGALGLRCPSNTGAAA